MLFRRISLSVSDMLERKRALLLIKKSYRRRELAMNEPMTSCVCADLKTPREPKLARAKLRVLRVKRAYNLRFASSAWTRAVGAT